MKDAQNKLLLPVVVKTTNEEKTEQPENYDETLKIEPVAKIIKKDNRFPLNQNKEQLLLRLYSSRQQLPILALFSGSELIDYRTFITALSKYTTNLNMGIMHKQFQSFRQKLNENAPIRSIFACGGDQSDTYVWKNATFDYNSSKIHYLQKLDQSKNYDDIQNSLIDINNNCRPELYVTEKNIKQIASDFFKNIKECFCDEKALLCFGAALSVIYWNTFQEEIKGFPAIFFLGESHSGKSTLMYCLSSIFGLSDSCILSGTSTPFAISTELNKRISVPVFIEELSQTFFKKDVEELVKNLYSAIPRERGTKTNIEKISICTTCVFTSNYKFVNPSEALLSRTLFVNMKKANFNSKKFKYFTENTRKELSLILPLLLSYKGHIIQIYKKVYEILSQKIQNYSEDRYLKSVAISCSTWFLVNHILGEELFDWKEMAISYSNSYEEYLESKVKNSDLMLRHISKLIDNGELNYNVHYKLIQDSILRLNLRKFIDKFNILFANDDTKMLTMADFCNYVEADSRFDTKRKTMDIGKTISINIAKEEYLLEIVKKAKHQQPFNGNFEDYSEV